MMRMILSQHSKILGNQDHKILSNNVLLVKVEGPVWYTIYHHLHVKGFFFQTRLLINQPMGKGHL